MRVAFVCMDSGVPIFGNKGCSIHSQEIIRALCLRNHDVSLFSNSVEGQPPAGLTNVKIHRLAKPEGNRSERERVAVLRNRDLHDALQKEAPFDLIYERYSLWSYAAMEYARDHGVPGILEVNAPLIQEQSDHRHLLHRKLAEQTAHRVFSAAKSLIAVSNEIATYLKQFPKILDRIHVVPNGVNPDRFGANRKPACAAAPGTFTVGFLGSLKPWHGLSILVEAFAMFQRNNSRSRLLIVGDGPARTDLVNQVHQHKIKDVTFLAGAVTPSEVPGWLASMDVGVAPYPALPNFYFSPLKIYEYMAAGLPVIASNIGQIRQIIEHESNGLLLPPGDPKALKFAFERLKNAPELRARLGQAGRSTVLTKHTWNSVIDRILALVPSNTVEDALCQR